MPKTPDASHLGGEMALLVLGGPGAQARGGVLLLLQRE